MRCVRTRRLNISCRFLLHSAQHPQARGLPRVDRLDAGVDSGVLAMDAYLFWPQVREATNS